MNATPAAPPRKRRRLWRFARRTVIVAVVLAVVARIALPFVLPSILTSIAAGYGLTARYDGLDLSILGGEITLRRLQVAAQPAADDAPDPEPYIDLEYATVDVDVSALWTGTLRIHRVEVDGLDVRVERTADGSIALFEHFTATAEDGAEPEPDLEPAEAAPTEPTPIDLALPFQVDSIRVQAVRLLVVDRSASPPLDTWIEADVRISDVGTTDRPARIHVLIQGPDLLDRLVVEGSLTQADDGLRANLEVDLQGLHGQPAAHWLSALGITPIAGSLDASAKIAIAVERSAQDPTSIDATIAVEGVRLLADGDEAFAVDEIEIEVRGASTRGLTVPSITVDGVRGHAALLADGGLAMAGIELRPVPAQDRATPPTPEPTAAPTAAPTAEPFTFALEQLRVGSMALALHDGTVEPPVDFELAVEEISVRDVVADPDHPGTPATLTLRARAPGIAEAIQVDATVALFAVRKTAQVEVRADQITLARIAPHLERLGLASDLQEGQLSLRIDAKARADVDGATHLELALEQLRLVERDVALASLARLSVEGVVLDPSGTGVRAAEVVLRGTDLPVRRSADGALHFAGLRTVAAPPAAPAAPIAETAPRRTSRNAPSPRFELGALRVRDTVVAFVDETVEPTVQASTSALEADVENLVIGGTPDDTGPREATVRVRVRADGIAEELGLRGTIASMPGPLDVRATLQIAGDRLAAGALAPYLEQLGIEPVLQAGRLRATLEATARATGEGLRASARITQMVFQDGEDEPFVRLGELTVDEIVVGPDDLHIGTVVIDELHLSAARDADGALLAMGLRFPPPAAGEPAPEPAEAPEPGAPPALTLTLDRLDLRAARLQWSDAAAAAPIEVGIDADVLVEQLAFGAGADPGRFELKIRVDGALEEASITGTVALDPDDLRAQIHLDAHGLRGGPLAGYLPPGVGVTLEDGRLRAALDARLATVEAGGIGIDVSITDVDLRDGDAEHPLLACESIRVDAPRIDPAGDVITIAELSMRGAAIAARRTPAGATELLGLSFTPHPASPEPATEPDPPAADTAPVAPIDRSDVPPRVVVEKLDLELARFRFEDASTDATAVPPIDGRLRLFAPEALVLLDDEPEALPPLEVRIEGAVDPFVESIVIALRLSPWQAAPRLEADLDVRGLRGASIPIVLPSLADRLDGRELRDGRLSGQLDVTLALHRRTTYDVDLSRGFGLEASLTDIAFRATPDGEVLAGVDSVFVEAPRITPGVATHVSRLEIDGIRGRLRRSTDGLHALGLTLQLPPTVEDEAGDDTTGNETGPLPAAEPPSPLPAGPELRVDEIAVHGLDFVFEDDSIDPPMILPIDGLDLEISGFSTRAFSEPRPVRFSVSATGGDVSLPKVQEARSIIAGVLGAAVDVVTGGSATVELEQRPFLDEIAVQGRMTFHPVLSGRVRTSISALELNTFRSTAKEAGVVVDDGVMDAGFELDFLGDDGLRANARITFDRLVVDEPPGGPISRFLKLPAPLNAVLFAVRDDAGQVEIPLSFRIRDSSISRQQVTREAIKALGSVLADAVAAAPFRITGVVTNALGLGGLFGGTVTPLEQQRVAVSFAPATTALARDEHERLRSIVDLLQDDADVGVILVHAFGPQDYERAAVIANPSPGQTRQVVARLRQRRAQLTRERAASGAEARALIATGRTEEADAAVRHLQSLDRQLGETELALDNTLELLRPGADRRADRRTRTTALEIGNHRLSTVERALLDLGGQGLRDRIEIRRARPNAAEGDAGGTVVAVPRRRKRS